jgi:hypothetical protein
VSSRFPTQRYRGTEIKELMGYYMAIICSSTNSNSPEKKR